MANINWYPGHMKKSMELIQENLNLVDLIIEVLDARMPYSSHNPVLAEMFSGKECISVLTKSDLADPSITKEWLDYFSTQGKTTFALNLRTGEGIKRLVSNIKSYQDSIKQFAKFNRPIRIMIIGVPNTGKSTLINRLLGKNSTETGNKPGVTRWKQWLTLDSGIQLLDTPGVLWPRLDDQSAALRMALAGSIKDEILDIEELATHLLEILSNRYKELLLARYHLDELEESPYDTLLAITRKRGFLKSGGRLDVERGSRMIIDEFRAGLIGEISLERAPGGFDGKE